MTMTNSPLGGASWKWKPVSLPGGCVLLRRSVRQESLLVRVVAPFQSRPIVTVFVIGLVARIGGPAQAGFLGIVLIHQLVLVADRRQACFDLVELRRGHDVLQLAGENLANLVLRLRDSIRRLRMCVE